MPTLIQQHNCKVVIYHDDHPPPHVHIKLRDGRDCVVDLQTFSLKGKVNQREVDTAINWIRNHQQELLAEWQRINP